MIGWNPSTIFACGLRMDSRMYCSSAITVWPFWRWTGLPKRLSRLGPRAMESLRWHVLQACCAKSLAPAEARDSLRDPPESDAWNAAGSITWTQPIIEECFVPQYCEQKMW